MTARTRFGSRLLGLAPIAWVAIGLYLLFLMYPILRSIMMSFTDRNPLQAESSFVGLDNYKEMFNDPNLARSLWFTLVVVVVVTVLSNAFGILFAILLNKTTPNFRIMRTLVFIPQVLSGVIVAFIWRSILTQDGLLNSVLAGAGLIDQPISWIGTPELATMSICVVVSWVTIAFTTVVYTASLQAVPAELYEAARMDGAGPFSRFWHVTYPMIAPGMTICVVLCMITTFKLYDIIAVLTGGGPANSTESVAMYVINVGFTSNRFGYSSALSILLLVLTAIVAYGVTAVLRRREAQL
ncbi:sugar ABC transporter permease [Microbacterium sp. H1-D42]|uniref:carbohydrate ABC transporter permease n=1 Tax=Microbacterium sp. H1-D42 TaxID=2925844 RepID=UPI001F52B9F5|nr:sugar ABC transporter permease [Microbacterium sp. H1-D42]UNK70459.1 sugar ABC transporter permease [Microbacterium sp. H1-D42]